jgi:hypothetical protein
MYYILTNGEDFLRLWAFFSETSDPSLQTVYERNYAKLADGCAEMTEQIPDDLKEGFRPILLSLLGPDPSQRASVEEITLRKWRMDGEEY